MSTPNHSITCIALPDFIIKCQYLGQVVKLDNFFVYFAFWNVYNNRCSWWIQKIAQDFSWWIMSKSIYLFYYQWFFDSFIFSWGHWIELFILTNNFRKFPYHTSIFVYRQYSISFYHQKFFWFVHKLDNLILISICLYS